MPICRAKWRGGECTRDATRTDLCDAHYEQQRRAVAAEKPVRFAEQRTARGEGRRVTVRLPLDLLEELEGAAREGREDVPGWIRTACRERLDRLKASK